MISPCKAKNINSGTHIPDGARKVAHSQASIIAEKGGHAEHCRIFLLAFCACMHPLLSC